MGDSQKAEASDEGEDEDDESIEEMAEAADNGAPDRMFIKSGAYRAGKWGRYLRAPDFYLRGLKKALTIFLNRL